MQEMQETQVRKTPGSGRRPGEGKGYPLQYSCLENPMDRRAWWPTVHGFSKESDMTEHTCTPKINFQTQLAFQETVTRKKPKQSGTKNNTHRNINIYLTHNSI